MYKVVLVDDEELIIEGMKQLIDWRKLDCEIAGAAYDGGEALDIVNEVEPDIVITDIRMPEMDGLEMIDHIKKQFPDVTIMIMSGYSDFEYAKQALEKGASCYLLKPVPEKELWEKMEQAVGRIKERQLRKQKDEEINIRLYRMEKGAKENFLQQLLKERIQESYVQSMWKNMKLCLPQREVRVAVLESDTILSHSEESVIKFAMDNIVEEICSESQHMESVSLDEERTAVLTFCGEDQEEDQWEVDLKKIKSMVERFCKFSLSVGVSAAHPFPGGLTEAMKEADQALRRRFYDPSTFAVYEIGSLEGRKRASMKELKECEERLTGAVKAGDQKNALFQLKRIHHMILEDCLMEPEEVYNEMRRILTRYQDIFLEYQENTGELDLQVFQFDYVQRFKTGQELWKWMESVTIQAIEMVNQEMDRPSGIVERIKKYIAQNYQTVTRQTVADYFFLNSSYLSQLFKAETGEVFTEYVTRIRMEEAKKLMDTTDYKIQYVAELVGYTSNQHFTRTFKKYNGYLPTEYKKKKGAGLLSETL